MFLLVADLTCSVGIFGGHSFECLAAISLDLQNVEGRGESLEGRTNLVPRANGLLSQR